MIPFSAQPDDSGSKRIPDELRKQVYASIGVSGEAEFGKVMKEYEEFCESLPEGADGPTFMEFRGMANAATESIKRTQAEAGGSWGKNVRIDGRNPGIRQAADDRAE